MPYQLDPEIRQKTGDSSVPDLGAYIEASKANRMRTVVFWNIYTSIPRLTAGMHSAARRRKHCLPIAIESSLSQRFNEECHQDSHIASSLQFLVAPSLN